MNGAKSGGNEPQDLSAHAESWTAYLEQAEQAMLCIDALNERFAEIRDLTGAAAATSDVQTRHSIMLRYREIQQEIAGLTQAEIAPDPWPWHKRLRHRLQSLRARDLMAAETRELEHGLERLEAQIADAIARLNRTAEHLRNAAPYAEFPQNNAENT